MLRYLLPLALVLGLSAGCYSDEGAAYSYGSPYYADDYGYVGPGMYGVYGYDYPVYFADGFYWRFYGGRWYSSHWRDHGWAYSSRAPGHLRGIARGGYHGGYRGGFHGNVHARGGFRGGGMRGGGFHGGAHGGHRG